jgi:bifunctional UDP-N-acetylglucosamine pyrophosphorylase/glucosamine-1-phosphate N-acetyltransferase
MLARAEGLECAVAVTDEVSVTGVNSRAELAEAEAKFQQRVRARLLQDGVTMTAPETVFFAHDTAVENDVEIEPFVVFGPGVTVKSGARLRSHSHLEGATVARGRQVEIAGWAKAFRERKKAKKQSEQK